MNKRALETTLSVGGRIVTAVSISGLAKIVGKSRNTLLRYERNGTLPMAIFLLRGYRYYPKSLAVEIAPIIQALPLHTKPPQDLISKLNFLFNKEREKYAKHEN